MPKYLVLYRSPLTAGEQMAGSTPEAARAAMTAWMAWGQKAGDALVDWGGPTQPVTQADPGLAGWVGGYSILQAEDADAVAAVLDGHPHTEVGTIEVVEILPMPGM